MRTRSFIGLAFLILALLVVSTPALLEPTAAGVESLAISTGVLEPPKLVNGPRASDEDVDPVEARLQLRGHVADENGDLRDVAREGARDPLGGQRLASGSTRRGLLGTDADDPLAGPVAGDALLLDRTGCPTFPKNADLATLLDAPETRERYTAAVAAADDPAACREALNAQIEAAPAGAAAESPTDATIRRGLALDRRAQRNLHAMVISLHEITLLDELLSSARIAEALDAQE